MEAETKIEQETKIKRGAMIKKRKVEDAEDRGKPMGKTPPAVAKGFEHKKEGGKKSMTEVKKDLQRSISAMEKTVCSLIKPKTVQLKNEREHERQQRLQQQQMQQQPQHVQQTQADTIRR